MIDIIELQKMQQNIFWIHSTSGVSWYENTLK